LARGPRYEARTTGTVVSGLPAALAASGAASALPGVSLLASSRSIFDDAAPAEIAEAFSGLPWVRRVRSVRRRFPPSFEVALEVRSPIAILCVGAERLALDAEGVVVERDSELGPPLVLEIRTPGQRIDRVPRVGRAVWQEAVLEALAVVKDLAAHRSHLAIESLQPAEVSVGDSAHPRKAGAGDIRVRLADGVWLRWGRSTLSPLAALELPVERKLDHLAAVARRFPGLVGIREVDLRFDDPRVVPR
jgi:cell division septal protein FtsQ